LSNFIAFDESTGLLTLEAGVTLGEVQKTFAPKGWMLSVTPGTQFVSVGGAIANDVHGKNHHSRGTFGDNTTWLELVRSDGQILSCSAHENAELFHATIGGLGLTGLITRAQIRLQKVSGAFLDTQNIVFRDANEFLALSDESEADWQYSVSWVDCTSKNGRGIFMRGNNANDTAGPEPKEAKIAVPFVPPISLINRLSVRLLTSCISLPVESKRAIPRTITCLISIRWMRSKIGTGLTDQGVFTSTKWSSQEKAEPPT
jgi:FAD/FMN-containing dehydrogenase